MSFDLYQPDSFIGRTIAGYEITDFMDSGAAGLVFRGKRAAGPPASVENAEALPVAFPDVAAIKLLVPSLGTTGEDLADFQRRFEREAEVLRQLAHPHILSVIDSGQDPDTGYFYIALPYMEGGSLASAIARRGPLPLPEVASILAQIAGALDFAHGHGVVHRDVKPANILLDAQGAPYLCDFGIVRLLSNTISTTQRTTIGRVMGSPAYMAPEQFSDTSRVGPLSDLYSLGMVVYQMVTGHLAFETTSWPSLIYRQVSEMPASPRSARPELPEPAAAAILNALEKDPARRFPTAAAFARAFALGLQGQWADGLMEYIGAATMPAAPTGPATTPLPHVLPASSAARTWPNSATMPGLPRGRPGGAQWIGARGAMAVVAIMLLVSGLVGALYIGANGSPQNPAPQAVSSAGSSSKIMRTPPTSTPRSPTPTATETHSGSGGVGAPTPTAPPTPTATITPTPSPSPTATITPTPEPPTPTGTPAPPPTSTPAPTPTDSPGPQPSISIGLSEQYSKWIWMTFSQFSPGAYTYTCNFGSGRNQSRSVTVSSDPQTWDNGRTCYLGRHEDTVWVTVGSVMSNVIARSATQER